MKGLLRRIGAVRSTLVAAGVVAAAVGVQVSRADEHMPGGFFNANCLACCSTTYWGPRLCTDPYECEGSMSNVPRCACGDVLDDQGRIIGAAGLCVYGSVPQ